jgi:hypothetical protein
MAWYVATSNPNSNSAQYLSLTEDASDPGIVAGPYATEAAAKAAEAKIGVQGTDTSILGAAENGALPSIANILGLPTLTNLRDLVTRSLKVIIGVALLITGVVQLTRLNQAVGPVASTAAKAAVL